MWSISASIIWSSKHHSLLIKCKIRLKLKSCFFLSCKIRGMVYSKSFHQSHSWQPTLQKTWSQYRTSASSERMFEQGGVYGCHWAKSVPLYYFVKVNFEAFESNGQVWGYMDSVQVFLLQDALHCDCLSQGSIDSQTLPRWSLGFVLKKNLSTKFYFIPWSTSVSLLTFTFPYSISISHPHYLILASDILCFCS